jgi:hypothetical protein
MSIVLDTGTISTIYTLSIPVSVTAGVCSITFAGVTKYIYPTVDPTVCTIRVATSGFQTLTIVGLIAGSNIFNVGQITLTQGYIQASFSPKHEVVMFNNLVTGINFTGGALSTGTYEDTSGSDYGSTEFLPGIYGMLAGLYAYDTGSSGAGPYFVSVQDPDTNADLLRIDLAGLPNSTPQYIQGIIKFRYNSSNTIVGTEYTWQVQVTASGAGSLHAKLDIFGIII